MDKKSSNTSNSSARRFFIFVIIIIFLGLWITGIPQKYNKKYQFVQFYNNIITLSINHDYAALYNLQTPDARAKVSLQDYVTQAQQGRQIVNEIPDVHSIEIDNDTAVIDRTMTTCYSTDCSGSDKTVKMRQKENIITLMVNGIFQKMRIFML